MTASGRGVRKDVLRNRALLLAAADTLIRERGLELSLNAVAREAGVGVGTVYRHFPDRETLIDALFDERVELVWALFDSHLDDDDPVEALRAVMLEVCAMQVEDRGVWEVLSSGRRQVQRETVQRRLLPVANVFVQRVNDSGRLRYPFDPNDLPVVMWTGGALNDYLGVVTSTGWRRYVELLFNGFLRDDDPARHPLSEAALTSDGVNEAMQAWRPSSRRAD